MWSLSLGMRRGKFGSSMVRWDYPKRRGEKAMWKKGRDDNTLVKRRSGSVGRKGRKQEGRKDIYIESAEG